MKPDRSLNPAQRQASKENWTLRVLMGAKYSIGSELQNTHLPEHVKVSMLAAIGNINLAIKDIKEIQVLRKSQKGR